MNAALFDLTGRLAMVTGSTRGLGRAIARGLAEAGATLAINGRDETTVNQTVAELTDAGLRARPAAFDVRDSEAAAAAVADLERAAGGVDILVNNAGITRRGSLEDVDLDHWREVMEVNLTAALAVTQAAVGGMIRRKRGKIVNICSLMSKVARETNGPYTASKGGLAQLTLAMACDWAKHNIQVNGIGPGYFRTDLTEAVANNPEFSDWVCRRTPAGRWGEPEDLIGAAVFLAGPASNFVTGQILYVDGGLLATV